MKFNKSALKFNKSAPKFNKSALKFNESALNFIKSFINFIISGLVNSALVWLSRSALFQILWIRIPHRESKSASF